MRWRAGLFWCLFILALPQALWLKWRRAHFSGPPDPPQGGVGQGRVLQLVGLGDSVIAGVGCGSLEQALIGQLASTLARRAGCRVEWSMLGQSGACTDELLTQVADAEALDRAEVVVVSTGVNDVTRLISAHAFRAHLVNALLTIRRAAPSAAVIVNAVPPMDCFPALPQPLRHALGMRARLLDEVLSEVVQSMPGMRRMPMAIDAAIAWCERQQPPQAVFAADGYHPSESSCALLAERIVDRLIAQPGSPDQGQGSATGAGRGRSSGRSSPSK